MKKNIKYFGLVFILLSAAALSKDIPEAIVLGGDPLPLELSGKPEVVSFTLQVDEALSASKVPRFELIGNKKNKEMFSLTVGDKECTGYYSAELSYQISKQDRLTYYMESKFPWSGDIKVLLYLNEKSSSRNRHSLDMNGEQFVFETHGKIRDIVFDSYLVVKLNGLRVE
ncbi:hypothetical protein SAMN02745866_01433 [Alteromonadaceae bacterium Bs31]|nr:hypothetical protein SAMN02745866_01433 [Alteromonadaceae bacterium Bs31]